jgi:hypothetical protein
MEGQQNCYISGLFYMIKEYVSLGHLGTDATILNNIFYSDES